MITLKHWAGYNVERNRGGYDDNVSRFDLLDSYLPAFRAAVTEGHAAGVMCSYNVRSHILSPPPPSADALLT